MSAKIAADLILLYLLTVIAAVAPEIRGYVLVVIALLCWVIARRMGKLGSR